MRIHAVIAGANVVLLLAAAGCGGQSQTVAETDPAGDVDSTNAEPPAASAKFVPAIRGLAEVALTKPVTKRVGNEIVTIIKVKNTSTTRSIAGLKVDEFWYNKAGEPVTGDTFRYRKPLQPGEVIEVTLRTPVNPRMDRNQYQFVHANGDIKATVVPTL